jgi:hypothetical protein
MILNSSKRAKKSLQYKVCENLEINFASSTRIGVDAAENSFVVKSRRLWNNLPEKMCFNSNIKLFKIALKNCILRATKRPPNDE